MMKVNFLVIFLNLIFVAGGIAIASLILYWVVRSVVRAELKRMNIPGPANDSAARDKDSEV